MEIVTAAPAPLTVSTSCPIAVGATSLDVTSSADGALVAVTDDGVLLGRATVSGGVASVTLDPPPADPGELDVVVTGRNLEPWEGTCQVIVPNGPWLAYRDHVVDDSAGNGDGIVNPGEAVIIAVTVENIGTEDGGSLAGVLTTTSGDATVTDGTAAFPDLATNTSGQTLPDHFAFSVDGGVANGTVIPFDLDWTAEGGWSGSTGFGVSVCEPLLISKSLVAEVSDD